jgi:predicted AAA+ superfamily ATPase
MSKRSISEQTTIRDSDEQQAKLVSATGSAPKVEAYEPIRVGDTLIDGRFLIESQLGAGGMGRVFRALDRELGRTVALKTFTRAHPTEILRIKREFRALAHVSHRNLISLYELFVDEDRWFFTMPVIDGTDLRSYLKGKRVEDVYAIFRQLAEGVIAIHDAGKLHCDLKPRNVLVTPEGSVVILDFGITVDVVLYTRPSTHSPEGTPAYMPPEQMAGQAEPASDWFAVGVMLYEILYGELPWDAETRSSHEVSRAIELPAALSGARGTSAWPAALVDLCSALLERDPARRPGDDEMIARLDIARRQRASSLRPRAQARSTMVGRPRELERLHEAFEATAHGRGGGLVLVCGPSGIGKTHLISQLLNEVVTTHRVTVFRGRCFESEALPYRAFDTLIDAISDHLATLSPKLLREVLPHDLRYLSRMFPVLQRFEPMAPDGGLVIGEVHTIRRRAVSALGALLERLSRKTPVVLHLDDLQWGGADDAALLIELLGGSNAGPRVLWLGSYRTEVKSRAPFLELMASASQKVETIELEPLGESDAAELARALLPDGDADQLAAIARESQGNPFFLSALAAHVALNVGNERMPAPDLSQVLAARCALLSQPGLHLLRVVALAGQPIEREIAHDAAGLRVEPELLAVLRNSGLIRLCYAPASNALECFHDRIRHEVVRAIPQAEVQKIRLRLAEELEQHTPEQAELIMQHYLEAGLPDRAAPHAVRAASAAEQALAFEQAATLYERAVQLVHAGEEQRSLRVRWAQALANTGRGARAAEQFVHAAAASHGREALDLERRAAHELLVTGHLSEGSQLLRKVIRSAGLPDPESYLSTTVALVPRALAVLLGKRPSMKPPRRPLDDDQRFALDVCWSAAWSFSAIDPLKFGLYTLEFIRHAGRSGDARLVSRARATLGVVMVGNGDARYDEALREVAHAKELAHDAETQAYVTLSEAGVHGQALRFSRCLDTADAAYAIYAKRVTGAHYEKVLARVWSLISLTTLGGMRELDARVTELKRDLGAKGDLYANGQAAVYQLVARTVSDDGVEDAIRELEATLEQLPTSVALILRPALIHGYLYLGRLDDAETVRQRCQREQRSHGRGTERLISSLEHKRGFAWLAIARARGAAPADFAREARMVKDIEAWMRRQSGDLPACYAAMQRAGIASARDDAQVELNALKSAAEIAGRAGFLAHEAVVRTRLGELLGGDEGRLLSEAATRYFDAHGFKNPRRFVAAFGLLPTTRS